MVSEQQKLRSRRIFAASLLLVCLMLTLFLWSPGALAAIPSFDLYCIFDHEDAVYAPGDIMTVTFQLDRNDQNADGSWPLADGYTNTNVGYTAADGCYTMFQYTADYIFRSGLLDYDEQISIMYSSRDVTGPRTYNATHDEMSQRYIGLSRTANREARTAATVLTFTVLEQPLPVVVDWFSMQASTNISSQKPCDVDIIRGRYIICQPGYDIYQLDCDVSCSNGKSVAAQVNYLHGADGYRYDINDTITWGDEVAFQVEPDGGYVVTGISYSMADGDPQLLEAVDDVYTIPDGAISGDTVINISLAPSLSDISIPKREDATGSSESVYQHYGAYTGGKTMTLLALPAGNWCFDAEQLDAELIALPPGLYEGYNYAAMIEWDEYDPDGESEQMEMLTQALCIGDEPPPLLEEDHNVTGLSGPALLQVQAVYDFFARDNLFWQPSLTQLLKADIDRDGVLTVEDVYGFLDLWQQDLLQ